MNVGCNLCSDIKRPIRKGYEEKLLLIGHKVLIGPDYLRVGLVVGTSVTGLARIRFEDEPCKYYTFHWDLLKEIR